MTNQVNLKTYNEVLQMLESNHGKNHLLLGNGFNSSLGVHTGYKDIFERMKQEYSGYARVNEFMETNQYDVEKLIETLKTEKSDKFLQKFIEHKIKFDFMKAAYGIVNKNIKNIYQKKNREIHLLLVNFTNYFTLNYDPFLYLLLMKFKSSDSDNEAIAFQKTLPDKAKDLNAKQNDIYEKIKNARAGGVYTISASGEKTINNLKTANKTDFTSLVKSHYKNENWTTGDIKRVCDLIWQEEKEKAVLSNIHDGFIESKNDFIYQHILKQNIYFLHGSFHIYKDKHYIKKITQKQNKALYRRLEQIINGEEENVVCIFKGTSEEKVRAIKENDYLKNGLDKLNSLQGHLVILGSSLANNDAHIFNAINQSQISNIYISCNEQEKSAVTQVAQKIFSQKNICLFDYETISYSAD